MHTVELVETEETRGQDYQGSWEKSKDIRLSGLDMDLVFHDSVGSRYKS